MTDVLLVERRDRIAVVTLNRPASRNALNVELIGTLLDTMLALDAALDVDVIVLTGADPAFCAGVDLTELGGSRSGSGVTGGAGGAAGADAKISSRLTRTPWPGPLPPLSKPLIGAVNGPAVTGGLELALACDFLVASERARFADTHARVGIMPGGGVTVRLVETVGLRRAKEMSITGNFLGAEEAWRLGLVNHLVPHEELMPFTLRLATDVLGNDQAGVRRMLDTYDDVATTTGALAYELEQRVSIEWEGEGIDRAEVARRRDAVIERGRGQNRAEPGQTTSIPPSTGMV